MVKINTPIDTDVIPKTKVLANGAVYDLEKKRIIANPGGGSHAITSERASEFAQLRRERKQAVIQATANSAVENGKYRASYGDDAWIAAITEAQYIKATTPDDPKSTDAARFLFTEAGISDKQQANGPDNMPSSAVLAQLAQFAADVVAPLIAQRENGFDNYTYRNHEVQDGDIVPGTVTGSEDVGTERGGGRVGEE